MPSNPNMDLLRERYLLNKYQSVQVIQRICTLHQTVDGEIINTKNKIAKHSNVTFCIYIHDTLTVRKTPSPESLAMIQVVDAGPKILAVLRVKWLLRIVICLNKDA